MKRPDLIKAVFHKYYPDLKDPLPITGDKPLTDGTYPFIAFEWIGTRDYLEEAKRKGMRRTRGANFTSADFTFRFQTNDNKIHLVLGEWKYTEEYRQVDKGIEVRKENYFKAFHRSGGVFKRRDGNIYRALFFDPFYQLMRLQLLAQEMEYHKEMDADIVTVLHVCPQANREFRDRVTSPYLAAMFPFKDVLDVWRELVPEERFMSLSMENLLDAIACRAGSVDSEWVDYLKIRYSSSGVE